MGRLLSGFRRVYRGSRKAVAKTGRTIDRYNNWVEGNQRKQIKRGRTALDLERIKFERDRIKQRHEELRRRRQEVFF